MYDYPFPDQLPVAQIQEFASAVAAREFTTDLLNPGWVIVGYGCNFVAPNPKDALRATADAPDITHDELVMFLDKAGSPSFGATYGDDPEKALPWRSIVKAVLKILVGLI